MIVWDFLWGRTSGVAEHTHVMCHRAPCRNLRLKMRTSLPSAHRHRRARIYIGNTSSWGWSLRERMRTLPVCDDISPSLLLPGLDIARGITCHSACTTAGYGRLAVLFGLGVKDCPYTAPATNEMVRVGDRKDVTIISLILRTHTKKKKKYIYAVCLHSNFSFSKQLQ